MQAAVSQTVSLLEKTKIKEHNVCSASALNGNVNLLADAMQQLVASNCKRIVEEREAKSKLPIIMQYDHWF